MRVVRPADKVRVRSAKSSRDGPIASPRGKASTELTVSLVRPRLPGLGLALVGPAERETYALVVSARRDSGRADPERLRARERTRFEGDHDLSAGTGMRVQRRRQPGRPVAVRENTGVKDVDRGRAGRSPEPGVEAAAAGCPEGAGAAGDDGGRRGPGAERDLGAARWSDDGGRN